MSREVDERIVAMYFDNKDFEKKAQTTIKTLGDLKNNLNIEKSIKGFDTLKKASESLKLDDMERKVKNLQNTFRGFGDTVRNVFNIGTGPLNSLHSLFNTFQSYVTKFIGFDIAGKLVNGLESAIRQLTVAPVMSGWNEYEQKMDSIKTIMSGTGESLGVVTSKIQELNKYADQTIYSFSDMTANIGKFTNNGIELDKATSAIKGVANATADAGQDAQKASQAMYNMSQAIGVGKMQMIDWKSIENANIATPRLKQAFMEAGVAYGRLTKELDKQTGELKYYLRDQVTGKKKKAPKGSGTKWYEVNVQNFRDTLKEDWLDNSSMLAALQIYSGDLKSVADFRKMGFSEAMGFTDEDIQKLIEIGENAMKAATEVRTFTKMYDALKEAAQSGWSESFEFIFGDMEEGTSLWTMLNDRISAMLGKSAEARNDALAEWRGMFKDYKGEYHRTKDVWVWDIEEDETGRVIKKERVKLVEAQEDGREVLVSSLMDTVEIVRNFGEAIGEAWSDVFGPLDGKKITSITNGFRDIVNQVSDWLGLVRNKEGALELVDKEGSRLGKLTKGLRGVFSIIKTVFNVAKAGIRLLSKLLAPFADVALNLFAKFGDFFNGLGDMNVGDALTKIGDAFKSLWSKITTLDWNQVKNVVSTAWAGVKSSIREWAYDNGLGGVYETLAEWKDGVVATFDSIKTTLASAWNSVKEWFETSGIAPFFRDIWGWMKEQYGIVSKAVGGFFGGEYDLSKYQDASGNIVQQAKLIEDAQKGTVPMIKPGFVVMLENIRDWLDSAWKGIEDFFTESGIGEFFSDVWGWISKKAGVAWESITGFFTSKPDFSPYMDADGNIELFEQLRADAKSGQLQSTKPGIVVMIENIKTGIEGAWNGITEWPGWTDIGNFFSDIWAWISKKAEVAGIAISDFFVGEEGKEPGIAITIRNIRSSLETAWKTITDWKGWKDIGNFFADTWKWIADKAKVGWQAISGFFTAKPDFSQYLDSDGNLVEFEKLREDTKSNRVVTKEPGIVIMLNSVSEAVQTAWNAIVGWPGWGAIGMFFTDTFSWIQKLVSGDESASAGSTSSPAEAVSNVAQATNEATKQAEASNPEENIGILERIMNALTGFVDKIKGTIETAGDSTTVKELFDSLSKIFEIIVTGISKVVGWIHDLVVKGQFNFESLWVILPTIFGFFIKFKAIDKATKLAEAAASSESIGDTILKIAGGLAIIAVAVASLGAIDKAVLDQGITAMLEIAGILTGLFLVFKIVGKLTEKESVQDAPVTSWERLGNNLIKWAGTIGIIWVAMRELPAIITAMKDSGISGMDVLGVLGGIVALVAGIGLTFTALGKMGGSAESVKATAYAAAGTVAALAIVLAGLLAIFGGGGVFMDFMSSVGGGNYEYHIKRIEEAGEVAQALASAVGKFIGGFSQGFNDVKKDIEQDNVEWAAEMAEEFTTEKLSAFARMAQAIETMANAVPENTSKISEFAEKLPSIGTGLAQFAVGFKTVFKSEGEDLKNANSAVSSLKKQVALFQDVAELIRFVYETDLAAFNIAPGTKMADKFGQLGGAAQAILEMIQQGIGDVDSGVLEFDATPIVDSIVIALGYGETSIAKAVHAMVQAGIDLSGSGGEQGSYDNSILQKLLTGGFDNPLEGANVNLFGKDGLEGLLTNAFGSVDITSVGATMSEQLGPLSTQFQDMFTLPDLSTQLGGIFPTNSETGEIDIESTLQQFQDQMGLIGEQLSESGVEVTIKPVFDLTDIEQGINDINAYFAQNPIYAELGGIPEVTINVENTSTLELIQQTNDNIIALSDRLGEENRANMETIANMATHIDQIANRISAMRIYLDTGAMAGAVDEILGYRYFLAGRTGG